MLLGICSDSELSGLIAVGPIRGACIWNMGCTGVKSVQLHVYFWDRDRGLVLLICFLDVARN